jgi:DNA polymerase/3'-5' exonuclease PolX
MQHADALKIAEKVLAELKPFCYRAEIAGSIRRLKPEVKDIEIVAWPHAYENNGMFTSGIADVFNQWEEVKTGDRYVQRILPEGIKLDLFLCHEHNWGWIFALRTGSSDFNFKYLDAIKTAGLRANDGEILNGFLKPVPLKEEIDFFNVIKMPFIKPENRI